MDQMDDILRVQGLRVGFRVGRRMVYGVNDVSFSLGRGRMLGIVGESGCGKSVTAHSILQLLPPAAVIEAGTIDYSPRPGMAMRLSGMARNGQELRSVRGGEIGMIFQDPMSSLDPVYTVGDQIVEALREHEPQLGRREALARAVRLLGELGIPSPEQRVKEYPHQFSGGMKQRVMIAIAMICRPKVLIADEPTTALDVTIQAQILTLMKRLQAQQGTSIILITHNMGIVAEACDDVAVMYMGRIVESGSLRQIFEEPLHPYTRALLRSVPVLGMSRDVRLASIPGATPDAAEQLPGCAFAPRCRHACEACRHTQPAAVCGADGHMVRCLLHDTAAGAQPAAEQEGQPL